MLSRAQDKRIKILCIPCRIRAKKKKREKLFIIKLFRTHIPAVNVERSGFFFFPFHSGWMIRTLLCVCVCLFFTIAIQNVQPVVYKHIAFPVVTFKIKTSKLFYIFLGDPVCVCSFFSSLFLTIMHSIDSANRLDKNSQIVSSIILECCLWKLCMKFVLTALPVIPFNLRLWLNDEVKNAF